AVIEEDLPRDRQAEAHPVADLPRGDVRLEDARADRLRDAVAAVADVEIDAVALARELEGDAVGAGVRAVGAEVHQHLAHEVAVGADGERLPVWRGLQSAPRAQAEACATRER